MCALLCLCVESFFCLDPCFNANIILHGEVQSMDGKVLALVFGCPTPQMLHEVS